MKKFLKRTLSVFLAAVMVFGATPLAGFVGLEFSNPFATKAEAATSGTCGNNLTWSFNDTVGELVISGVGLMTEWRSSSNVPWFNFRSSITSVIIDDGVTSIGDYAFCWYDNLVKVVIPDSVTIIGDYAFYRCSKITSIVISDGVTSIGNCAFTLCFSLTNITVDPANMVFTSDENGVLFDKDKTNLIQYPIGNKRVSYSIPDSVINISKESFMSCTSLTNVTIPDDVTSIGEDAFFYTGIYNDDTNWENNVLYIGKHLIDTRTLSGSCTIKAGTQLIADRAFENSGLTSIYFPESITHIGDYAFSQCSNITNVTIGEGVINIGNSAFSYCTGLTEVIISNNVTNIGSHAFEDCESLISITIPDSVTSIGGWAFSGTGIYDDNLNWENDVLYIDDCLITTNINFSCSSYTVKPETRLIADYAFWAEGYLTSVIIPDSVKYIGNCAFESCDSLTIAKIGSGVINIGDYAFGWCYNLSSIDFGNRLESIGYGAFIACYSITNITLGNKVTSIGESAFSSCDSLTAVTIPDSVKIIDDEAFYNCRNIETVTIGNGVTDIGCGAFYNCENLTSIKVNSSNMAYSSNEDGVLFNKNKTVLIQYPIGSARTSYSIPDSVIDIGSYAFYACDSLESVKIPNGVKNIGDSAFQYCYNLANINIPDSVTSIGCHVFSQCVFVNITLGNNVKNIGDDAFWNCYKLESIIIPDTVTSIGYGAFDSCYSITDVYYTGTEEQWKTTEINEGNDLLTNATIHYNYGQSEGCNSSLDWSIDYPGFEFKNGYLTIGEGDVVSAKIKFVYNLCDDAYVERDSTNTNCWIIYDIYKENGEHTFLSGAISVNGFDTTPIVSGKEYNVTLPMHATADLVAGKYRIDISFPDICCDAHGKQIPYNSSLDIEITDGGCCSYVHTCVPVTDELKDGYVIVPEGTNTMFDVSITYDLCPCSYVDSDSDGNVYLDYHIRKPNNENIVSSGFAIVNWENDEKIVSGKKYSLTYAIITDSFEPGEYVLTFEYPSIICDVHGYVFGSETQYGIRIVENTIVPSDPELVPQPSASTISYGDSIVLHADTESIPAGGYVEWTASNGNFAYTESSDGSTCTITPVSSGDTTFTATVYDAQGNAVSKDEQTMTSKAGFFQKIIAFFKKIFGLNKVIEQRIKFN